jgi:hypothetical protein
MGGKPLDSRSLEYVASLVRRAIANERYALWFRQPHAFERMAERDVTADDVLDALKVCRIVNRELRGNWRYTAQGKIFDGREINVVCEIEQEQEVIGVLVITVW